MFFIIHLSQILKLRKFKMCPINIQCSTFFKIVFNMTIAIKHCLLLTYRCKAFSEADYFSSTLSRFSVTCGIKWNVCKWSKFFLSGLSKETWKVRWILMEWGRRKQTAAGLMTLEMGNKPTNHEANFLDFTLMGKSCMDSQTFCPGM